MLFCKIPHYSTLSTILIGQKSRRLFSVLKAHTNSTMSNERELEGSLKQQVADLFEKALTATVPDEPDVESLVAHCHPKFGDYQWYFGMLLEYLFEELPDWEAANDQAIGDLEAFYKASKQKFDNDPAFKERARQAVVRLQGGQEKYRKAWTQICEISRRNFEKVYHRLGVHLEEKVVSSVEETSRLLLCEATAVVMRKCFDLLGITPVYKI